MCTHPAMELVFGYIAGLLTLINPCVLPILPIVLATSLQVGRMGPVAVAAGMSVTFVALGLFVNVLGRSLGISAEGIAQTGALLMVAFGMVLLIPQLSARFAVAAQGFSTRADSGIDDLNDTGLKGQFLAGALLGAVWSPCIGPTLGGAISLASQGESLIWAGLIMTTFALGVSTVIVGLGYGARSVIQKRQAWMRALATKSRPIIGAVFVIVGLGLFFKVHHYIEFLAIQYLPAWLLDLSVIL